MSPLVALVLSFLAGSIPAAYIAGRMHGIDLRAQGSGNLGATNVIRVLGPRVGIAVFLFDLIKGALPVILLPPRTVIPAGMAWPDNARLWLSLACGVAAIAGHVRPIFLKFGKGGKGVATATGVFVALAPIPTLSVVAVFATTVLTTGYVSLGSLVSAALLPVLLALSVGVRSPLFVVALVVASFVYWTHRANIGRLRQGEEHRFGKANVRRNNLASTAAILVVVAIAVTLAVRFA